MTVVAEKDRANHGGTKVNKLTGQSLLSLLRIADDRNRWATTEAEASVGLGCHGR